MRNLGELERSIMGVLWEAPTGLPVAEVRHRVNADRTQPAALTTVLTVLSRLESKGLIATERGERPRRYRALDDHASHTAQLMRDVLGSSQDREAALARFLDTVPRSDVDTLRRLLG
ncbi:MAG TPA: BlaI/MecI/CopY family transcriptional regulator [Microbacteriaceae bacterium]|nr:BlaI/MecI/CopY family transcriptional regulator [Microbacteriaceae bacterium]